MRDITVLSTACGAPFMPGFFKCLRNNNERSITIVGTDLSNDCSQMLLFVDKYFKVPRYDEEEYVDRLLSICEAEHVDVFFPHISMELPFISERLGDFNALGVKVAISNGATLALANNKYQLYEYIRRKGIDVPQYFLIESAKSLRDRVKELGFPLHPVVVKMAENSGSRGVRVIKSDVSKSELFMHAKPSSLIVSLEEMCEIIDDIDTVPEMIAMEYFPGVEYTVDLLADYGETLYIAGRRNTTSSFSIAQSSIVEYNEHAYEICKQIVRELKLDGNIGFDFMFDENDTPWLTDLNPRVTATIVLYAGAGINFPYLRVKQLMGEELPSAKLQYGTKLIRKYWDGLYNDDGSINW